MSLLRILLLGAATLAGLGSSLQAPTNPGAAAATGSRPAVSPQSWGRPYCDRCGRPPPVCLCPSLPPAPIDTGTRVLILQHPKEARKRKRTSTVPLIGLCMEEVQICRGARFAEDDDCPAELRDALDDPGALLLYPGDGATPLEEYVREEGREAGRAQVGGKDEGGGGGASRLLVVVDGTWAQAQGMVRDSPCLGRLTRVMFDGRTGSLLDPLRREPASHCTSTLEAVSRALRLVGTTDGALAAADAMERSLRAMVDGQLRYASDPAGARPRYKRDGGGAERPPGGGPSAAVGGNRGQVAGGMQVSRRRTSSRRRRAQLSLRPSKTAEELEQDRIRFIYVAHLG